MITVRFLKTIETGQEEIGSVSFSAGKYITKGLATHLETSWKRQGIFDKEGNNFKMSEGKTFMEKLCHQYSGSYLRATEALTK